jgi:hypothetical protein
MEQEIKQDDNNPKCDFSPSILAAARPEKLYCRAAKVKS